MRSKYWSDSKLAHWIRGTPRPTYATLDEWDEWHDKAKTANPVRHWLAEELLNKLQDIVCWPKDKLWDVRCYAVNRWVDKTHYMQTDLEPGQWHEFENRLLHGMFTELVDFVEVETALFATGGWGDKHSDPRAPAKWRRWIRTWRSSELGVLHFREQIADNSSFQFNNGLAPDVTAKEVLELYFWWTCHRPHRKDPHDASGWSDYCRWREVNKVGMDSYVEPYTRARVHAILDLSHKIEKNYDDEDTEMMVRLVKLRKYLWT